MGNITLVFAPTRPVVAIKNHHSSKHVLFSNTSTEIKWLAGQWFAQQKSFSASFPEKYRIQGALHRSIHGLSAVPSTPALLRCYLAVNWLNCVHWIWPGGGGREKKFFHKTTPSQKTKSLGTTAKNFNPTCTNSTITRSKIQADTPHFTLSFHILVWPWKMERIYNAKEFKYCITFLHRACLLVPKS